VPAADRRFPEAAGRGGGRNPPFRRVSRSIPDKVGRTPPLPPPHAPRHRPGPGLAQGEDPKPPRSGEGPIAHAIVADPPGRGVLRPGMTLIEATAGNTGVGLALVAAVRGYDLVCVMPEKMCADKRVALEQLGARVVITPNAPPSSPDNFRKVAERVAREAGVCLKDQLHNPLNLPI